MLFCDTFFKKTFQMRWRLCEKVKKAFSNINLNDKLKHYSYIVVGGGSHSNYDVDGAGRLVTTFGHIFRKFIAKVRNFDFYNSGQMR